MGKIKNFMNKPITWGTSFKLSAVSMLITLVYYAFFFGWFKKLTGVFKKKVDNDGNKN